MNKRRELYAEQVKKGFVRIKVAQPNVWLQKQKWVWVETHPWLYNTVKDGDVFVFMDGNNRNFSPDNIEKVTRGELGTVNRSGGFIKGEPELNRLKLYRVRLKTVLLDKAEEVGGLLVNTESHRILKSDARKIRNKLAENEEYRAKTNEATKRWYYKMKQNPEKYKQYRQRMKEYHQQYKMRKKGELNND